MSGSAWRRKGTLLAASAALAAYTAAPLAQDPAFQRMVEEARAVAARLLKGVGGALQTEMQRSGPERSILVCKYSSPEVASELSRATGWRVARVSLKPRNPSQGAPDAWEQGVLLEFDRRARSGEKPETLEHAEVVKEAQGSYFRYLKALPVREVCLDCHGPAERIKAATRARLAAEYPFDKATGYHVGEVRGAVSIKRPL